MPTTDWNWFFSSVAQSAAAIVGIFGAFIITKILANQSAFAEKSRRIQELITFGERIVDASTRLPFVRYHKYDSADELESLTKILENEPDQTPEELYEKLRFSPYIARGEAIETIRKAKSYREHRLEKERQEQAREAEMARSAGLGAAFLRQQSAILAPNFAPHNLHIGPQLTKVRDEIDDLYTDAKHHSKVVGDFHALVTPQPESSTLITSSLTLILTLFFVGVIYPLSFMPLPTNWKPAISFSEIPEFIFSIRGLLLILISALFTTMLAIFFVINIKLKYSERTLQDLAAYKALAKYSQFFANREENVASRRAVEG